jgi:hypothetical protein
MFDLELYHTALSACRDISSSARSDSPWSLSTPSPVVDARRCGWRLVARHGLARPNARWKRSRNKVHQPATADVLRACGYLRARHSFKYVEPR